MNDHIKADDEEINFRRWLASRKIDPVTVDGDDEWNQEVLVNTMDYVFGADTL